MVCITSSELLFGIADYIWSKSGIINSDWFPRSRRQAKNVHRCISTSSCLEQSWNILRTFPTNSLNIASGGCQEWGGMYMCNASAFSNKVVSILVPTILMIISMKSTCFERFVKVQLRPLLFTLFLNNFQMGASTIGLASWSFCISHCVEAHISFHSSHLNWMRISFSTKAEHHSRKYFVCSSSCSLHGLSINSVAYYILLLKFCW